MRHAAGERDLLEAHLAQIAEQRHGFINQGRLEDIR